MCIGGLRTIFRSGKYVISTIHCSGNRLRSCLSEPPLLDIGGVVNVVDLITPAANGASAWEQYIAQDGDDMRKSATALAFQLWAS